MGDRSPIALFICNNVPNVDVKFTRIVKPKESLEVQELETPKTKGPQDLVEVQSSGVCHSELHLWEGGYEGHRRTVSKNYR